MVFFSKPHTKLWKTTTKNMEQPNFQKDGSSENMAIVLGWFYSSWSLKSSRDIQSN